MYAIKFYIYPQMWGGRAGYIQIPYILHHVMILHG